MSTNDWTRLESLAAAVARTESRAEGLLLVILWPEQNGWTLRVQHEVGPYRVDLAIPEARIAVEVDGVVGHTGAAALERDHERQNALVAAGWTVLRFSARKAYLSPSACASEVLARVRAALGQPVIRTARPRPKEEPQPTLDPRVGARMVVRGVVNGVLSAAVGAPVRRAG